MFQTNTYRYWNQAREQDNDSTYKLNIKTQHIYTGHIDRDFIEDQVNCEGIEPYIIYEKQFLNKTITKL